MAAAVIPSVELFHRRKIKDPCPTCAVSRTLCVCDVTPKLDLRTKICLVIHHRELSRNSNTGLLALRALANGEVRIRGEGKETLDLTDLLTRQYRTFVFFPSADAVELDKALVTRDQTPIQLIVPDGTWRQASRLNSRQAELKQVPRVRISTSNHSTYQLRAQSRPEGMATLQAIASALGIIEGEEVRSRLMKLYQAKIERALKGRGMILS